MVDTPPTPSPAPAPARMTVDALLARQHHDNAATAEPRVVLSNDFLDAETRSSHASAARSLDAISSASAETKAEALKEAQRKAAEATLPEVKKIYEKQAADLQKQLGKDAEATYKSHGKAVDGFNKAVKALDKEAAATLKRLETEHKANVKAVTASAASDAEKATLLEHMNNRHIENVEALTEHVAAQKEVLTDKITEANKAVTEIEKHSGVKASDLGKAVSAAKAGSMTEAAYKEMGLMDKVKSSLGKDVSGGTKALRIGGGIVGLGALIDGTKKIIAPKRNEKGEREGSLFGAVGEAGVGAVAAYVSLVGGKGRHVG